MSEQKNSSPNFNGKIFLNPVPTEVLKRGTLFRVLKKNFTNRAERRPKHKLGPFEVDRSELNNNTSRQKIRIVWLGHSTCLIEIEEKWLLTDPVYSRFASPFSFTGPERFFEVPLPIDAIPPLSGVIISHDHYDHLDRKAVIQLANKGNRFFCPLGVGERLRKWGIASGKIHEFDWWDELPIGTDLNLIAAPARHFSGRSFGDRFQTLWASWIIQGKDSRVYYGADSGMFPGFDDIGKKFGPFDLTLLEIGAYNLSDWPEIHMGPENAVNAHMSLQGKVLLPIHWGTFNLAFHPWKEPAERVIEAAKRKGIQLLLPEPGQINSPEHPFISHWWAK